MRNRKTDEKRKTQNEDVSEMDNNISASVLHLSVSISVHLSLSSFPFPLSLPLFVFSFLLLFLFLFPFLSSSSHLKEFMGKWSSPSFWAADSKGTMSYRTQG